MIGKTEVVDTEPKKKRIALTFDLDSTLIDGLHPNLLLDYMGVSSEKFWKDLKEEQRELFMASTESHTALYFTRLIDEINHYNLFIDSLAKDEPEIVQPIITREVMRQIGRGIDGLLFPGLPEMFEELPRDFPEAEFGFHLISSGMKPLIEGSILARYFTKICAYDFVYSKHDPQRIAGVAQTVSSDEKENILIRLSKGNVQVGYEWPIRDTLIIADGETDISLFKVGRNYKSRCFGVISCEEQRAKSQAAIGKYVDFIFVADYRKGSELRRSIEGFVSGKLAG